MTPFLKYVADDLCGLNEADGSEWQPERFRDTTIIFPNKRASLFFNEYLWQNAHGQTMWTPEYQTISELFASLSDCTAGDSIYLTVKLWEVYSRMMRPAKTFDQLYGLMETMLSDFQDIDNNLVDPHKLFLNIADLKEMTDFSFLEPAQREAIEQFFGKFFNDGGGSHAASQLKSQFKTLWNHLAELYKEYQNSLLNEGEEEPMVYEGMLKRRVVEALTGADEERRRRTDSRLTAKTYVIVGFNVLNQTELELFQYIKQHREAKFYWDYDVAYMRPHQGLKGYEAGQFIMENIKKLGDEFAGRKIFDNMHRPKDITFIQSPTDNAQCRYVDEWLSAHVRKDEPLNTSAIILCDENLLQPVLHSISHVAAVNVTMGYPLTSTPVFSLIQALLELQMNGRTPFGAWKYRYVAPVLKHALVQKLAGDACHEALHVMVSHNVVFPKADMFAGHEVLTRIFNPVSGRALTAYLADIISLVGQCYQDVSDHQDFTLQMEKESLFVAYTAVNRIQTLQESHAALRVGDAMLSRLILQLMSQATIPFHGEPAVGLQVMGLLETRNLDFRHVVMLSVNEGQLPKSDKRSSLIPYTLRAAYGMTTIEREVSLYAYYYYRLMQRAESVTLLYNSSTDNGGRGEMSRFMLQTLAEKEELFAPGQEIMLQAFAAASEDASAEPFSVKKTPEVVERLHHRFGEERILSPSAINTYMKCPLKFYLCYVAGLRSDDEVSDDVDKPMFGTIFHETMHNLYAPYVGHPFRSSQVKALAQDEKNILQLLNNAFAVLLFHYPSHDSAGNLINYSTEGTRQLQFNGTQLINRHVIKQFIINQLSADAQMAERLEQEGGYWQIISQEQQYTTLHQQILLGGIVDRLDLLASPLGNRIRIVDYKTSSSAQTAKTVEDLFDLEKCTSNYHIMQILYYCKVLTDIGSPYADQAVVPALMYCAKDYGKNCSGIVRLTPPNGIKKEEVEDFKAQYAELFNRLLTQTIEEIFTPYDAAKELDDKGIQSGVFAQCADEQHCAYCDFLTFCRRHPRKDF